jgi:Mlc titration factor MtfA (ptsG expression regulator)
MGHVDQSGIYLSWDNFIKGISGQTPYCNVGLHEMGHALAYVTFITETEEDKHFKKEFKNFSKVARPIFTSMQTGNRNLLGEYAAVNYHEFWAVSVETFFKTRLFEAGPARIIPGNGQPFTPGSSSNSQQQQ